MRSARTLRGARLVLMVWAASAVAGCASFSGMPEPVISTAEAVQIPEKYRPAQAVERYHSASPAQRDQMTPMQWRNAVVLTRMGAADARYHEFRVNLSREVRGANFGIETAVLGLAGVATVSGVETANALAAAIAALTGARASLSREVYFERTLPALIAGMDVSRLEVATRILTGLARPAADYPIEVALMDALAYERAASLDQAIQVVTAEAAEGAADARRIYSNVAQRAGIVPADALPITDLIGANLDRIFSEADGGDVQADAQIAAIMLNLNVARTGTLTEQLRAIAGALTRKSTAELVAFVTAMRAQNVVLDEPVT